MPKDMTNAYEPGDICKDPVGIFQEVGPRGGPKSNCIAVPQGRALPSVSNIKNKWVLINRKSNASTTH